MGKSLSNLADDKFDAARMGWWRADLRTGLGTCDANLNRMLGLDEVVSTQPIEDCFRLVHPDDKAAVIAAWRRAVDTKGAYGAEFRIIRDDGSEAWLREIGCFVADRNENPDVITVFTQNITDQKATETALRESEDCFRTMADNVSPLAWICDKLGNVTWYNKRWLDYTGLTFEEMRDWGWTQVHHPDHVDRVVASVTRSRESGEPWEDTFPLRGKDDNYRWFLSRAAPIRDAAGEVIRWFGTNTDITAEREAEAATARLAAIVQSSNDAIISKDLNGIITSWNAGAQRLFGYTAEEAIGCSITMLIPPDRHHEENDILARIKRGEQIEHFETKRQRKDGSLLDVSLMISPIRDQRGRIIGASKIARNITDRKQAEARMQLLAHEADHRGNNLLTAVQAIVQLTQADSVHSFKTAIEGRIRALSKAHTLFAQSRWAGAELHRLVTEELSPFSSEGTARANISGPDIILAPEMAQSFAVILHELATNAAKYGALSVTKGSVRIEWLPTASGKLALRWAEMDGPSVKLPSRQGFGTRVIGQVVRAQLKGEVRLDWRSSGLVCEIEVPM